MHLIAILDTVSLEQEPSVSPTTILAILVLLVSFALVIAVYIMICALAEFVCPRIHAPRSIFRKFPQPHRNCQALAAALPQVPTGVMESPAPPLSTARTSLALTDSVVLMSSGMVGTTPLMTPSKPGSSPSSSCAC